MLFLKLVLAFCSLSYELILAQGLSAFLDNTVLRYSTTIGLYMFAMGLGALASAKVDKSRPALCLWQTEILLTLTGAISIISLFVLSAWHVPAVIVVLWAYCLVLVIGFLTGLELPLILLISSGRSSKLSGRIIAMDYAGACAATVAFVFYFYPVAGLLNSVMSVVFLNACAVVFVAIRWSEDWAEFRLPAVAASLALAGGILSLLLFSGILETQLLALYIK